MAMDSDELDPSEYDYGDHKPRPAQAAIRELQEMIDEAGKLDHEVAQLTAELGHLQNCLSDLTDNQIPNKMKLCGLKSLETEQGYSVKLEMETYGNIPSVGGITKERDPVKRQAMIERREACFRWLEDNQHDKIVTRQVIVQFDKDQKAAAQEVVDKIKEGGKPLHVTEELSVHHQTLNALIRRLRKDENVAVPEDIFGLFDKATAKVSKR